MKAVVHQNVQLVICSGTWSQCKSFGKGATWSYLICANKVA